MARLQCTKIPAMARLTSTLHYEAARFLIHDEVLPLLAEVDEFVATHPDAGGTVVLMASVPRGGTTRSLIFPCCTRPECHPILAFANAGVSCRARAAS